jgi:hypothetical protein
MRAAHVRPDPRNQLSGKSFTLEHASEPAVVKGEPRSEATTKRTWTLAQALAGAALVTLASGACLANPSWPTKSQANENG